MTIWLFDCIFCDYLRPNDRSRREPLVVMLTILYLWVLSQPYLTLAMIYVLASFLWWISSHIGLGSKQWLSIASSDYVILLQVPGVTS